MIQTIIHSYWNSNNSTENSSGFNNFRDLLASTSLSALLAKKHFKEVNLITNDFGKYWLKEVLCLPYSEIDVCFNDLKINSYLWAYGKMIAYYKQTKPFLHIDNDVYLISKPSKEFLEAKLCFQQIEEPFEGFYGWYNPLLKTSLNIPVFPKEIRRENSYAYNCGVAGGNDLSIIEDWFRCSTEYCLSKQNENFFKDKNNLLIHQNLLHEQYFIADLAKSKGYENGKDVKFILNRPDIHKEANEVGYAHLWGTTKKEPANMNKVYQRLKREFPDYHNRIINITL